MITRPDVKYALTNGYHESMKDQWKEEFQSWNYSFRGKTVDGENVRIIVSLDDYNDCGTVNIITVIRLEK